MADSIPYDYSSWQFYDAMGQQQGQFPGMDEDFCVAPFNFPAHSAEAEMLLGLGSDNCTSHDLRGGISAKMGGTDFAYASQSQPQAHALASPMEMLDIDTATGLALANHELDFVDSFTHRHGKKPCTDNNHDQQFSSDFNLLRSTARNATERALFMTIPSSTSPATSITSPPASSASPASHLPLYQSPILDCCSSPGTTPSHSEDDWDREIHHFYGLPETATFARPEYHAGFAHPPGRVQVQAQVHGQPAPRTWDLNTSASEELTPLEMPDGTTRFTANWLPVDPLGGFTIGCGTESASTRDQYPAEFDYGRTRSRDVDADAEVDADAAHREYDPMPMEFSKEAFIVMPV